MADYHSLLMRAVANLPNAGTPATRGAIYGRARKALLEQLRSLRPPLPESDIAREETALDAAIAEIEERYGSQELAPTPASPAPAKAAPPPPPQPAAVQRPAAPGPSPASTRASSQMATPGKPAAPAPSGPGQPASGHRPQAPTQVRTQPAASPPQAPLPPAGKPAAVAPTPAVSPARAQLAAAIGNSPSGRAAPPVGMRGGRDDSVPGVAALDAGRAVRPNKADDANGPDAPPVVATHPAEEMRSFEAPAVAAEMDRPGLVFRPEAEIQRPIAPGVNVTKPKPLLWIAAAVVLGIVLAVAAAAILMRQKPQDLAIKPPVETQQPAEPESSAKIAQRVQTNPPSTSPPAPASGPQANPSSPQGAPPASPAETPSQPAAQAPAPAPSAGRAAMLVASADNPQKPAVSLGSTVWSLIPAAPGQPSTVAVKAEADIPDLKMHATMTLRKNTDPTLQATHTIDLKFSFADGAPITGFKDVGLPQMRKEDSTAAEALTSVKVKISDTYFLIALAKGEADTARNLDLMQTRTWFDFPLLLNDDRIAKVVFQKSAEGQAMLEKAFEAWK
jgi:hypothetical protein